ncbi:MAG: hypothetical protein OHK0023_02610 [Anaerolineae bacterium]
MMRRPIRAAFAAAALIILFLMVLVVFTSGIPSIQAQNREPEHLLFASDCRPALMYAPTSECPFYYFYFDHDLNTPVAVASGNHLSPSFSPDGSQIVFTFAASPLPISGQPAQFYIEVMDADGTNRRRLTNSGTDRNPAWSPNGETIAFISDRGSEKQIHLMDADGSNVRALGISGVIEVSWSPDSKRLLYTTEVTEASGRRVNLVNADGTNQRLLIAEEVGTWSGAWSPDGRTIAYVKQLRDGRSSIFLTSDEGITSRELNVTEKLPFAYGDSTNVWYGGLAWSADGAWLAFEVDSWAMRIAVSTPVPKERIGQQIGVVEISSGRSYLVTYGFNNCCPAWRP